ncbi:hypothetical protein ACFPRL_06900 [Pseudoclavibacter helvolus]
MAGATGAPSFTGRQTGGARNRGGTAPHGVPEADQAHPLTARSSTA